MDIFDMYPLDFEEFALAVGVAPTIIGTLEESFRNRTPVDRIVHERMMKRVPALSGGRRNACRRLQIY